MGLFPVDDPQYAALYAEESAMVDASELIGKALEQSGLSQAELAKRLGVQRSEINARLKGERNITVRTLAETIHALGARLTLSITYETRRDTVVDAYTARAPKSDQHEAHEGKIDARRAFEKAFAR